MRQYSSVLVAAVMLSSGAAQASEALYNDPALGTQMTSAQIKSELTGNSALLSGENGAKTTFFFAPDGSLRQQDRSGAKTIGHWGTRDYDNLFCFDTGGPCVQFLRSGDTITIRRKDGLVEFGLQLVKGNPAGL